MINGKTNVAMLIDFEFLGLNGHSYYSVKLLRHKLWPFNTFHGPTIISQEYERS